MKLLLSGATGLVGGLFMEQATDAGHEVITVGRRATGVCDEEIITDFSTPPTLPAADAAICALGTTIRTAGSQAAFHAVDHDAVLCFARSARDAGVTHFLVVTAIGADVNSSVFYSRVKGETERDLEAAGFERLDIAQPGLLLGARTERRPVEKLLQIVTPLVTPFLLGSSQKWGSIHASQVAAALLALCDGTDPGVYRHDNRALKSACRSTTAH